MNDKKRTEVSNKLMDAARCVSKDNIGCILNDALHGEKKLSGINENCSVCCSVLLVELADLIKPSGHECVPGECPLNVCHDNDRIDRDALLALADNLNSSASMLLKQNDLDPNRKRRGMRRDHAQSLMAASSRIREVLEDGVKLD